MWGHMFFVSTILISPDVMWMVTKAFEGYFVFGTRLSRCLVSAVVAVVLACGGHALLAMRKFPGNWRPGQTFVAHRKLLAHEDTTLWWVQAVTGFALFFLASAHLYQMLMHPGAIGPYESGRARVARLVAAVPGAAAGGGTARRHRPVPAGRQVGLVRRRRP
jgi:fumarate reductase subunit C